MNIDRIDLFKEKLSTGINLFTGAGFSCLPDAEGRSLPTASELCGEIFKTFSLPEPLKDNLEALSAVAPKQQFQNFLRTRFTIETYNGLYDALNKIKMLSFITTNIDNIIHKVIDNSTRYYLNSITYYGATQNAPNTLDYIPLHGDVTNLNFPLYFSKFDLAAVDKANSDLFKQMHSKLLNKPTLFWGYGFHDSGVLKTVSRLLDSSPHDIWVQCLPDDTETSSLYKALGCNIVFSDTNTLLEWIDEELVIEEINEPVLLENDELKPYFVPTISSVESVRVEEYYQKSNTHWHPIISGGAYELPIVNDLYDLALSNNNLILVGGKFTGKTTVLMQLALKVNSLNKLYLNKLTLKQAQFISRQISNTDVWVFYHNCAEDIDSFIVFAKMPNVKVIGIAEDYQFESVKHLLAGVSYKTRDIGELEESQAQNVFEYIPTSVRLSQFIYKDDVTEKFSMLEMISKNVRGVRTKDRVRDMLIHLFKNDVRAFEAVALAVYLTNNGSALSIDVMFPFFSILDYTESTAIINNAMSLLNQTDAILEKDEMDQDYFVLRSKLFSYHASKVLLHDSRLGKEYAKVIEKFTLNVSPYRIFRNDIFRRSAHDSELFFKLFGTHANEIYEYLYQYDENPYTLQQWALCRSRLGDYSNAFIDIDKALSQRPNNFSMQNSLAIILFEANKNHNTPLAVEKMNDAMSILRKCYCDDKRKVYHAQKFAEFALALFEKHRIDEYLNEAKRWIDEIVSKDMSKSYKTKQLKNRLCNALRRV